MKGIQRTIRDVWSAAVCLFSAFAESCRAGTRNKEGSSRGCITSLCLHDKHDENLMEVRKDAQGYICYMWWNLRWRHVLYLKVPLFWSHRRTSVALHSQWMYWKIYLFQFYFKYLWTKSESPILKLFLFLPSPCATLFNEKPYFFHFLQLHWLSIQCGMQRVPLFVCEGNSCTQIHTHSNAINTEDHQKISSVFFIFMSLNHSSELFCDKLCCLFRWRKVVCLTGWVRRNAKDKRWESHTFLQFLFSFVLCALLGKIYQAMGEYGYPLSV